MRSNTKQIISTTMAGTTQVFSDIVSMENVYTLALQHIASGTTAAGSIQIQGSCQEGRDESGDGVDQWANIGTATTLTTLGTAIIEKDAVGFRWLRVSYTPNNGDGTLVLILNTKGS